MQALSGFWSYVHADDETEGGRIAQLARDVADQYQLLTGEEVELFLDRDAIKWGDDWHDKINEGLSSVAFFIPVLTPRQFMSAECRRELQFFARRAADLGVKELVLPLLYVAVPALDEEEPGDALVSLFLSTLGEPPQPRPSDLEGQAFLPPLARGRAPRSDSASPNVSPRRSRNQANGCASLEMSLRADSTMWTQGYG